MKIIKCRNCNQKKLVKIFSLGNICYTGKFPHKGKKIRKAPLSIARCKNCSLVQLENKFNLKYLYGPDYGYRSGINETMVRHLKKVVEEAKRRVKLKKKHYVLDIASNDATLLKFYSKDIVTFGIDPLVKKYIKEYKKINFKISDFFSKKLIRKKTKNKFKIITALSVFYDLEKPNKFMKEVQNLLDEDGIFVLEFADLDSILKNKMFDTICHEHLEYYSTKVIADMCKKNKLKIIDILENNINGSSKQFYITHLNTKLKTNKKKIKSILSREVSNKTNSATKLIKFFSEINKLKVLLLEKLDNIKKQKKTIHGYGASTKGNVLLQYFKIGRKYIDYIAERNEKKFGLYTPGTNIKIISERQSREKKPDFYLVLPWHFKDQIIKRERKIIKKGIRFIFPLPKIQVH